MQQLQAFREELIRLSIKQLVDLLTEKSLTLLDWNNKTVNGVQFQRLLQEIEDITEVIKVKKLQQRVQE